MIHIFRLALVVTIVAILFTLAELFGIGFRTHIVNNLALQTSFATLLLLIERSLS